MLARLFLLIILLPVLEIAVLFWLADLTNWLVVVGLLIGAGVLGAVLARQQSLRSMRRLSDELRGGKLPGDALFDAMLVSLAGLLLILPGLLSDVVALLLLFPMTRRMIKAAARRRVQRHTVTTYYDIDVESREPRDEIIDVKVIER